MKRLFSLAVLLVAGCHGRTEVVIGVATDLRAKGEIDLVTLTATRSGVPVVQTQWPLTDVPAGLYELPGSFGLYSGDGSEPSFELSVVGTRGSTTVADREAILSLVSGQTLFARMTLTSACDPATAPACAGDESCVEGSCQKRLIDPHQLPKYRSELVKSTECDGPIHYIVSSTGAAMGSLGATCPAGGECHEGTCWTPPKATGGGGGKDLSFCVPVDLGLGDGGENLVEATDIRIADAPVDVGNLFCGQHFFPNAYTLNSGDGVQFTGTDGQSHHMMTSFATTADAKSGPVSLLFASTGDFTVTCTDHPSSGNLLVHVVN